MQCFTSAILIENAKKMASYSEPGSNKINIYSLHDKLFMLPARGTCANGIFTNPPLEFTSPPYQDNFSQGLDQRLK